jgi:TRAP-type C4-dicarboxylate transport system permease small subunit
MKARYVRAMDALNLACLFVAGMCLVVITIIIPWGVFTRFVLNSASSWPEPMAVLLMVWLSLLSAVVCYRENLHIGVGLLPAALTGTPKKVVGWIIELGMLATNMFMLWWGVKLVAALWYQSIAEFPMVSVGVSYLPIPIGGALIVLFVIERLWTGKLFEEPSLDGTPISSE